MRCNGITAELLFSIPYWSGALWAQAGLTKNSPPGLISASERLSRAGRRYRVLMVEKLQKKRGEALLSTHTVNSPSPPLAATANSSLRSTPCPLEGPSAPLGGHRSPRPWVCPASPGTSLPQRCSRDGPAPPQRAGLQISAAPAPPSDPRCWRHTAMHAGACSPAALLSGAPAERGTRCFGTRRCRGGGTGERARTHLLQRPAASRFFPFQLSREAIARRLPAQRPSRRCGRPQGPSWVWRSGFMRGAEVLAGG